MSLRKCLFSALAGLAIAASSIGPGVGEPRFAEKPQLEALSGVYASTAPEPWYGGFGTRRFEFQSGSWSLVFEHALDEKMERKTFRFRTFGPYRIGEKSASVAGAYEAIFGERQKLVTLLTDDPGIVANFGFAACGLHLGVEVDVSVKGCAGWKPVAVCGEDHDLLALEGARLYFGVRPRDNDMCTPDKRPTALLGPVLRR
jgi:hypothetical protein